MAPMSRFLRIASVALITAALVIGIDVGMTLAWKEPLSSIYGSIQQGEAESSLADLEQQFPCPEDLEAVAGAKNLEAAGRRARRHLRRTR